MKFTGPKAKRVRRHGTNIYGSDKYDKILQKKPYGPGKNEKTRSTRPSEFGRQLLEKQKARYMFGLSEKQFHRLYQLASSMKGQTGDNFLQKLECRLDNTIYRAGFAMTRLQSRQFVGHGLFLVNGRRVTVPSFQVKPGDKISARPRAKTSPVFPPILEANDKYMAPAWLRVNAAALEIEIVSVPAPDAYEQAIDVRQVIEFYSRR